MAEQASRRGREGAQAGGLGEVRIEEPVVLKLAGLAAREVEGVEMRRSSAAPAIRGVLAGVAGGGSGGGSETSEDLTRGVHAEVGQEEAAVDLMMAVEFGKSIPLVTDAVRRNVINRVESLLGLRVARVGITVVDVLVGEGAGGAA